MTDVENGLEAKEELLKNGNSYDLVLLDLMMPEMVREGERERESLTQNRLIYEFLKLV